MMVCVSSAWECRGESSFAQGAGDDVTYRAMNERAVQEDGPVFSRGIFDDAPIPMGIVSAGHGFVQVNEAFCEFFGYAEPEMLGKSISDITHPDDLKISAAAIHKIMAEGTPIRRLEKRYVHKSGKVLTAELNIRLVRDDAVRGRVFIVQLVDITERKRIQLSLQESEDRFRRILEQSPMSMAIVGMDGMIEYINKKAVETFGYLPEDIPNMDRWWAQAYPDEAYRKEVVSTWMGNVYKAIAENHDIEGGEYCVTCKDGVVKTAFIFGVPVSNKIFVMFDDITERKALQRSLERSREELEQKVKDRTAKLRALAGEMVRLEHRERRRIAHVLHEDLQQWLAAAKFRVGELHAGTSESSVREPAEQAMTMLDKAIEITRSLSVDLSPPVLFELGLKAVLEWLAKDMKRKFDLGVVVDVSPKLKTIPEELTIFVFEAVRELLMNVTKHAGVKTAEVSVGPVGKGKVKVEVRDNGMGFVSTQKKEQKFGLFSIWERVDELGGSVTIQSEPGKGTIITLVLAIRGLQAD